MDAGPAARCQVNYGSHSEIIRPHLYPRNVITVIHINYYMRARARVSSRGGMIRGTRMGATNRWVMPCLSPYHFSSRPRAYHGEIRECLDVGVAEERLETVPLRSFHPRTRDELPPGYVRTSLREKRDVAMSIVETSVISRASFQLGLIGIIIIIIIIVAYTYAYLVSPRTDLRVFLLLIYVYKNI